MINGRTPSAKLSAGGTKKHGARCDRRTCTSHETPVLYPPAGREVCTGQRLTMPVRQSSLHELLPIGKLTKPGPYTVPYCINAHDQRERKH